MKLLIVWSGVAVLASCGPLRPDAPPPMVRVDTVVVTREAPLPQGVTSELCLSTGLPVQVLITPAGDTLIGEGRASLNSLRPVLTFAGRYAAETTWFTSGQAIEFEERIYLKLGPQERRACDELKLVGSYDGVPVFAEITAPQTLPLILLPVRPSVFQAYVTSTPRRR